MIDAEIRNEVIRRLEAAANEHNVKILFAVESGNRAWGFASPNSDYDVRFVYAHREDWYLSVDLEDKRDVIEYAINDDIDLSGWDVRKALTLFWKSNPAFVEWIQAPYLYQHEGAFLDKVRHFLPSVYSVDKGIHPAPERLHRVRACSPGSWRQFVLPGAGGKHGGPQRCFPPNGDRSMGVKVRDSVKNS